MTVSRAIAFYGTDEEVPPPRVLRAGKLSAELEAGNLRYLRWGGEEVLRAVSFIVRDKDWGTYAPAISDLEVDEDDAGFQVRYRAEATEGDDRFSYRATIEGRPDGTLRFHGAGESATGFLTNRTGFVILHPIRGVAGEPVRIEHTGGEVVDDTFPTIIDPLQPMMDLRALTHTTPGGVKVRTLMQGDTFEMEDQRNWTDASYKTYVRPLALPWPYRIEPGETIDQTITVTLEGEPASQSNGEASALTLGEEAGTMPPLGIGLRPDDIATAKRHIEHGRALAPAYVVVHHDPRTGRDRATLEAALAVVRDLGADAWLEAVIAHTDDEGAQAEVEALGALARELGDPFTTVLVSPAPDLKCTLPGSQWPPAPDATALYEATRKAFPDAVIGGGMFSYFTELNRKRPPTGPLDLVSFTTSPMVHAGDDRSVMETREAHGAIIASVAEIAGDTPWAVGPSAIGVRDNPYGEAAKINPENVRQAMNWNDPRQRGLLGAAWNLAYAADFALGGAAGVALGSLTGPFGALDASADYPRPWFSDADERALYPVFHVLRGLRALRGATLRRLHTPDGIAGLAATTDGGTEMWLANLGPDPVSVSLGDDAASVAVLDAVSFERAASDARFMDATEQRSGTLELDGFAVARLVRAG